MTILEEPYVLTTLSLPIQGILIHLLTLGWGLLCASRTPPSRLAGGGWALRLAVRPVGRVVAGLGPLWAFGSGRVAVSAGLARGSVGAPSPVGSGFLVHSGAGVLATCIYASLGRFTITPRRGISGSAPYQCIHNLYSSKSTAEYNGDKTLIPVIYSPRFWSTNECKLENTWYINCTNHL